MVWMPNDNFKLVLNGDEVHDMQVNARPVRKMEMSCLGSYNLNYSTLDFSVPMTYKSKLFEKLGDNKVEFFDLSGRRVFNGYVLNRSLIYGEATGIIRMTATPWLGMLAKSSHAYSIPAAGPASVLAEIFAASGLPYAVDPGVQNGLSGIAIAVDTGGKEVSDITLINEICGMLHIGVYLDGDIIRLFAVPEEMLPGEALDETSLVQDQPRIDDDSSVYFDRVTLSYKHNAGDTEHSMSLGQGSLVKTLTTSNVYMDDVSALALIARQYALMSSIWKTFDAQVHKKVGIGDRVSFDGHNFFVYAFEDVYTHYKIKCYGKAV